MSADNNAQNNPDKNRLRIIVYIHTCDKSRINHSCQNNTNNTNIIY